MGFQERLPYMRVPGLKSLQVGQIENIIFHNAYHAGVGSRNVVLHTVQRVLSRKSVDCCRDNHAAGWSQPQQHCRIPGAPDR